MTNKKINVILMIMLAFIVLFLAGSFAYENYLFRVSDENYSTEDLDSKKEENGVGNINNESQNK